MTARFPQRALNLAKTLLLEGRVVAKLMTVPVLHRLFLESSKKLLGLGLTCALFEEVRFFKRILHQVIKASNLPLGVENQFVAVFNQGTLGTL